MSKSMLCTYDVVLFDDFGNSPNTAKLFRAAAKEIEKRGRNDTLTRVEYSPGSPRSLKLFFAAEEKRT